MDGSSSCCPDPPKRKREDVVFSPTHATDRISQLPQPILHHILSFLRTKDVVRTGILSKTWYHTSTSFAISDFCQSLVGRPLGGVMMEERIHIFVEFVRKSLQSQCQIYGIIPKFALYMIQHSPHTSSIEDCIQLATQNNVKELDIKLRRNKDRLIMPQTLLSAKELIFLSLSECHLSLPPTHGVPTWPFLRKLCLQHCHVDEQIFQNLTFSCPLLESLFLLYCDELRDISLSGLTKLTEVDIARKFDDTRDIMLEVDVPCLKTFSLFSVRGRCNVDLTACKNITILKVSHLPPMLSSQDLTNLIAGLPALESLKLCWGSDRIRFSSQRLEKLHLSADKLVETDLPDLIAGLPALKFLSLHCQCERIKFSSQRLEKLHLSADQLVETDLPDLIAGLPTLKFLSLHCQCERIKFSSQRLEKLQLSADKLMETDLTDLIAGLPALKFLFLECKLERINFSSQQLEHLQFSVYELVEVSIDAPSLKTFECSGKMLSSDLFMGRSSPQEVTINFFSDSASSFLKLRKFLGGFKQIKLLRLCISRHNNLLPAELMDIPLPALPDIKHLRVRICRVAEGLAPTKRDCVALLNGLLWSCRPESISLDDFWSYGKFMTKVFCEELSEMVKGQHCCTDDDHIKCWCHDLRNFQIKQSGGNADTKFISCDALLELLPTLASEVAIHFMLEW